MIEFLARNGRQFLATDVGAASDMMVKIAGSEVDPAEVEDWIADSSPLRLRPGRLTDRSDEAKMSPCGEERGWGCGPRRNCSNGCGAGG